MSFGKKVTTGKGLDESIRWTIMNNFISARLDVSNWVKTHTERHTHTLTCHNHVSVTAWAFSTINLKCIPESLLRGSPHIVWRTETSSQIYFCSALSCSAHWLLLLCTWISQSPAGQEGPQLWPQGMGIHALSPTCFIKGRLSTCLCLAKQSLSQFCG